MLSTPALYSSLWFAKHSLVLKSASPAIVPPVARIAICGLVSFWDLGEVLVDFGIF